MTLSIKYPNFQISSSFEISESLHQLLYEAWQNHYEELYEEPADGIITLEETLSELLDALGDKDNSPCHYRYVCMGLILALAVEPTIKAYLPNESKTEQIFQLVVNWFENKEVPTEETIARLFPQKSVGSQAVDEALDVFKNLLRVLNSVQAKEALLEILDDCLEGYAIFPGSKERRDLFDWWLLEVVPATWCLKFPESLYTIKGIIPFNSKTLPNKLLNIFDNYRSKAIAKVNNNYQPTAKDLLNQLNINLDEVPLDHLPSYTAVEYFLTVEDKPSSQASNLDKVNRYLESFFHLGTVENWQAAKIVLINKMDTSNELFWQLGVWGYYQEQIELLEKILHKLDEETDLICFDSIGIAHRKKGNYQEAVNNFQEALSISRKINNQMVEASILTNLGNAYRDIGEYDRAIELHSQALSICREYGDLMGEGMCLGNLGIAYRDLGNHQKSIELQQQYLEIAKKLNNRQAQSTALSDLGVAYTSIGEYEKAIKVYEQCRIVLREVEDYRQEILCLSNMGLAYGYIGKNEKAISLHKEALLLAKKSGDRRAKCNALIGLGIAHCNLKEYTQAIDYYEKGLQVAKTINNYHRKIDALTGLKDIYSLLGDYRKAINYKQQGSQIVKNIEG